MTGSDGERRKKLTARAAVTRKPGRFGDHGAHLGFTEWAKCDDRAGLVQGGKLREICSKPEPVQRIRVQTDVPVIGGANASQAVLSGCGIYFLLSACPCGSCQFAGRYHWDDGNSDSRSVRNDAISHNLSNSKSNYAIATSLELSKRAATASNESSGQQK